MSYFGKDSVPLAIAHRGGSLEAPENTLKAFQYAIDLGYTHLETDVRITKDNVLVIYHDKKVDRLTNGIGKVSSLNWQEISQLDVGGEPIPKVEDVLRRWPDVYWNLDPKQTACVAPLAALIQNLGMLDRVCIGSFLGRRQKRSQKLLGPELLTSASPLQVAKIKFKLPKLFLGSSKNRPECLQVPLKFKGIRLLNANFIKRAHLQGMKVHIWTIDDPETIEELLDLGVDGIMTDAPRVLKEVFVHRNLWQSSG